MLVFSTLLGRLLQPKGGYTFAFSMSSKSRIQSVNDFNRFMIVWKKKIINVITYPIIFLINYVKEFVPEVGNRTKKKKKKSPVIWQYVWVRFVHKFLFIKKINLIFMNYVIMVLNNLFSSKDNAYNLGLILLYLFSHHFFLLK